MEPEGSRLKAVALWTAVGSGYTSVAVAVLPDLPAGTKPKLHKKMRLVFS
jgi:hypothetical protein